MVVYDVNGTRFEVDASFLAIARKQQTKGIKGVYGWYVQAGDLSKLGLEPRTDQKIYLYVGTVTGKPLKCVTSRFLSHLCGTNVETDGKGKKFDTDFTMSCVIAFLSEKSVDVHFHILDQNFGATNEVKMAQKVMPVLQKVTPGKVQLHSDIKGAINGKLTDNDLVSLGDAVVRRLGRALSDQQRAA
jgi:hypothetical protein